MRWEIPANELRGQVSPIGRVSGYPSDIQINSILRHALIIRRSFLYQEQFVILLKHY